MIMIRMGQSAVIWFFKTIFAMIKLLCLACVGVYVVRMSASECLRRKFKCGSG